MPKYLFVNFAIIIVLITGIEINAQDLSDNSRSCDLSFHIVHKDNEKIKGQTKNPEGYKNIIDDSFGERKVLIIQKNPVLGISDLQEVRQVRIIDEMRAEFPNKKIPPKLIQYLSEHSTLTFIFNKTGT